MMASYIEQANQKLSAGKVEEALYLYRQAIENNPGFCWHHHYLGEALARNGIWEEAVAAYQAAIELNPSSAWSHYRLGQAFLALGKVEVALASYSQAVEYNPNSHLFQKTLADTLARQGETEIAAVAYRKSLQLEPNQAEVEKKLYDLARIHLLAQKYDLAIKNCLSILEKNAGLADIIPILGEAYTSKGELEQGDAFLKVTPYLRRLVCRPVVQKLWGNIVEGQFQNWDNSQLSDRQKIHKIVIYTCVWSRPELTRVVLSHYSDLQKQLSGKIQLELLAVGSEGETSRQVCESCGFDYLEHPNLPLSAKWEYGLNRCADYDPDAVIIVGSDDIVSRGLIEFYDQKLREGLVFVGIKDGYFWDVMSGQMMWWKGYGRLDTRRFGETIGMARCLARPLLDRLNFSAWKGLQINKRLDRIVTQKLLDLGLQILDHENLIPVENDSKILKIGHCGFWMQEIEGFAVDIKTSENITPFSLLKKMKNQTILSREESAKIMSKHLPKSTIAKINSIAQNSQL
ncbi:tetratricopeptide repeat protein [Lyngbya sp. CCY1209]|uniref:tetratricopeptide repeat protein n=1 Tax=Lyngbya sp. CCY1209 TaxID=2886103 RepID=UPI002D204D9E|nr:tetratricopeptide repeat protein [Lyngbya sp. CCY1209]MEB3884952.1 tetratricopeptide repeat protein [Lyngbya sp. CCY1209]